MLITKLKPASLRVSLDDDADVLFTLSKSICNQIAKAGASRAATVKAKLIAAHDKSGISENEALEDLESIHAELDILDQVIDQLEDHIEEFSATKTVLETEAGGAVTLPDEYLPSMVNAAVTARTVKDWILESLPTADIAEFGETLDLVTEAHDALVDDLQRVKDRRAKLDSLCRDCTLLAVTHSDIDAPISQMISSGKKPKFRAADIINKYELPEPIQDELNGLKLTPAEREFTAVQLCKEHWNSVQHQKDKVLFSSGRHVQQKNRKSLDAARAAITDVWSQ